MGEVAWVAMVSEVRGSGTAGWVRWDLGCAGSSVIPSRRSSRLTSISPTNRQATAPSEARTRKNQACESPLRALEPKSIAA